MDAKEANLWTISVNCMISSLKLHYLVTYKDQDYSLNFCLFHQRSFPRLFVIFVICFRLIVLALSFQPKADTIHPHNDCHILYMMNVFDLLCLKCG